MSYAIQNPSSTSTSSSSSSSSKPPSLMSDHEQRERRASIKAILADQSLTPLERRKNIQQLMDGRRNSMPSIRRNSSEYIRRGSMVGTNRRGSTGGGYGGEETQQQQGRLGLDLGEHVSKSLRGFGRSMIRRDSLASGDCAILGGGGGGGEEIDQVEWHDDLDDASETSSVTCGSDSGIHPTGRRGSASGIARAASRRGSLVGSTGGGEPPQDKKPVRASRRGSFIGGGGEPPQDKKPAAAASNNGVLLMSIDLDHVLYESMRMEKSRPECNHYERKCTIISPCCGIAFGCRVCHDECPDLPSPIQQEQENEKGSLPSVHSSPVPDQEEEGDGSHIIDRFAIREIICRECYTRQSSKTNTCTKCKVTFGQYHCSVCNLWMSNEGRPYHCPDCGFCRVGGAEHFRHCHSCGMCIDTTLFDDHRCKAGKYMSNCPVCQEDLFSSRSASHEMPCGHTIHCHCFEELTGFDSRCPVCKKTAETKEDMAPTWNALKMNIAMQPVPVEMAKVVTMSCNDCERKEEGRRWHFLGVQCRFCDSFNTNVEQITLVGREAVEFLGGEEDGGEGAFTEENVEDYARALENSLVVAEEEEEQQQEEEEQDEETNEEGENEDVLEQDFRMMSMRYIRYENGNERETSQHNRSDRHIIQPTTNRRQALANQSQNRTEDSHDNDDEGDGEDEEGIYNVSGWVPMSQRHLQI